MMDMQCLLGRRGAERGGGLPQVPYKLDPALGVACLTLRNPDLCVCYITHVPIKREYRCPNLQHESDLLP